MAFVLTTLRCYDIIVTTQIEMNIGTLYFSSAEREKLKFVAIYP